MVSWNASRQLAESSSKCTASAGVARIDGSHAPTASMVVSSVANDNAQASAASEFGEPSMPTTTRSRAPSIGAEGGMTATGIGEWVAVCRLTEPSKSRWNPPMPRVPRTNSSAVSGVVE